MKRIAVFDKFSVVTLQSTSVSLRTFIIGVCVLTMFWSVLPATAQTDTWTRLSGKLLTEYPAAEPGFETEKTPWWEDIRRTKNGLNPDHTPEIYRETLRMTGMADHLAGSSLRDRGDRDTWSLTGPIGAFGAEPRNGRISGIQLIEPENSSTSVYVGSCQGGLWVARNSDLDGGIWENIGSLLPNPSVRAFAVDPVNDQHIIVGTGDHSRYYGSGIYETYNGGDSWQLRATPTSPVYYYRLFYQNRPSIPAHQHVLAASNLGLFVSSDRGASWSAAHFMSGDPTSVGLWSDLVEHPTQPNILYACVGYLPWEDTTGVYKSIDYGETWYHLPDGILPQDEDWGRASMAICRSDPDVLVVMVEAHSALQGIFKTEDGGGNWSEITGSLAGFGTNQIVHAQAIAIRPTDPDDIFVGAASLARSTNGGASWLTGSSTGVNWGHADITQLYFSDVINENVLWICNDGGVYYHDFGSGGNYSFIGGPETGLVCSEVDFLAAERDTRAIGMQDNGILISYDNGETWAYEVDNDGADVEIFNPVNGDLFFNCGAYTSEPAWRTFRKPHDSLPEGVYNPYPVYMPRLTYLTDTGKMATHDENSIYTLDAEDGSIWEMVVTDLQPEEYSIQGIIVSQSGDGTFYVIYWGDNEGDVTSVRQVPGQGWVSVHTEDIMGTGQAVHKIIPSREWQGEAWAVLSGLVGQGKIMHTTDYGATWEDISNEMSQVTEIFAFEVQPFNPRVLFAGSNIGMFRSTNGGQSWEPFQDGLPIGRCMELHFDIDPFNDEHTLELAIDGRGLWSIPIPSPRIIFVDQDATGPEAGSREYPFHSISAAVQIAPANAIIAVRSNTYNEPYIYSDDVQIMTWSGNTIIR